MDHEIVYIVPPHMVDTVIQEFGCIPNNVFVLDELPPIEPMSFAIEPVRFKGLFEPPKRREAQWKTEQRSRGRRR